MHQKYVDEFNGIRNDIKELSVNIIQGYKMELEAFKERDVAKLDASKSVFKGIDTKANAIDNRIIKVFALFEPEAKLLRELVALLKTTNELSRISSSGRKYAVNMKTHIEEKVDFKGIEEYLILIHEAAVKALEYATRLDDDTEKYEEDYKKTMIQEAKTDDLYSVLEKEILSKMCQGEDLTLNYINILNIARKFERVADHAANIAKMYLYAKKGGSIEVY